jgi:hypothetical protein
MDKFKNFINENRNEFETFSAPDALWAGISQDLQKHLKASKQEENKGKVVKMYAFSRPLLMRVAAGVALILAVGIGWIFYQMDKMNHIAQVNPPLSKTEQYYDDVFQAKLIELKQYEQDDLYNPELLDDIQELEQIYNDLRNDLKEDANNEQVIEAMIRNYRIRIELLERMLDEIKTKKNPTQDEKEAHKNNEHS